MAVAGPRAESVARTPENTAVARREAPALLEREARLTERVSRLIGAPHPRHCPGTERKAGSPGAAQTTRAIAHAWREAGKPAARGLFEN